jgi:hypothetical protein
VPKPLHFEVDLLLLLLHDLQALVRDDNAENAALWLPLVGQSCRYKMNQPHYYFECLVLGLEWHRAQHTFRFACKLPHPACNDR